LKLRRKTDLDASHVPKTARDERKLARQTQRQPANANDNTYHLEMARLYRQHVLGEKPTIQIQPLRRSDSTIH